MDLQQLEKIKRLVIIAMFSDDDLMDMLVLKGGNALDIVYKVALRASVDVDFSIESEFKREELDIIKDKIKNVLEKTFRAEGYEVFDINFVEVPETMSSDMGDFWGGYRIEFKIMEVEKYKRLANNLDSLRRNAAVVGLKQKKIFKINISKYEFCTSKQELEIEGFTIYVYSPEMIVFEKLRAICQQMSEYTDVVKMPSQSARARDFFDIYTVLEHFGIDIKGEKNIALLRSIFEAKKVPLKLIGKIQDYREFHRSDFEAVRDTVKPDMDLKEFDFYFDYVVGICQVLKALWKV